VNEYIEDLVSRIKTPLLHDVFITFFHQLLFDTSKLGQFISCIEIFKVLHQAEIHFYSQFAWVRLYPFEKTVGDPTFTFYISCTQSEWQLSSLAEVCCSFSSPFGLSSLERLDILVHDTPAGHWYDDMESTQWLELFQPFTSIKDLYLCQELAVHVSRALQELTEASSTGALPALRSIFVHGLRQLGSVRETIVNLIAVRQLSGNPLAVHHWDRKSEDFVW
jgi:hypothetical protein